jgi:hypothetical protein
MLRHLVAISLMIVLSAFPTTVIGQGFMAVQPNTNIALSCKAITTELKHQAAVSIFNVGNVPIAAGTSIHWSIERTAYNANYLLPAALGSGAYQTTIVGGPNSGFAFLMATGGKACTATLGVPR